MLIGSEFKEEIKWAQISLSDFFWSQRCIGSTILDAQRFPHTCGTQSVVSGLPTSEAPRNLWGMEVLRAYPGLNQTQGTAAVCGLTSSWGFYVLSRMTISVLYLLHYGRNKTPMVTAGLIVSQVADSTAQSSTGDTSICVLSSWICWERRRRNLLKLTVPPNF